MSCCVTQVRKSIHAYLILYDCLVQVGASRYAEMDSATSCSHTNASQLLIPY